MRIDIITIFPEICRAPLGESMMRRAQEQGHLDLHIHDLREFTTDRHRKVDDEPYGGGQGMVMKPEPFFAAVDSLRKHGAGECKVLLMTPQGVRMDQRYVERLAAQAPSQLIILCGHYEGIDHRVIEMLVDEEVSIGDYVLTNGAIAAVVLVDAVMRLVPGVLGDDRSAWQESFSDALLEAPHYTRPAHYHGAAVPEVLLSGNHAAIEAWRKEQGLERTRLNRPDLLAGRNTPDRSD